MERVIRQVPEICSELRLDLVAGSGFPKLIQLGMQHASTLYWMDSESLCLCKPLSLHMVIVNLVLGKNRGKQTAVSNCCSKTDVEQVSFTKESKRELVVEERNYTEAVVLQFCDFRVSTQAVHREQLHGMLAVVFILTFNDMHIKGQVIQKSLENGE